MVVEEEEGVRMRHLDPTKEMAGMKIARDKLKKDSFTTYSYKTKATYR